MVVAFSFPTIIGRYLPTFCGSLRPSRTSQHYPTLYSLGQPTDYLPFTHKPHRSHGVNGKPHGVT